MRIPIISCLLTLAVAGPAAAESLRCGTELVGEGESAVKLLEACGEPVEGAHRPADFDEWTYNFGPTEFMMRVTIRDGTIERIERLGYGFVEDDDEDSEVN